MTFRVVHGLLRGVMPEVLAIPEEYVIGTPGFLVAVRPPCSGYQGIGLMWVFVLGYLWLFRRSLRFPQAFVLLPIGTVLVWVANALRIAALVAVGTWISPEVALGGFHHNAGALLFCAIALGMVAVSRRWRFVAATPDRVTPRGEATAARLVPLLAIVATAAVTAAFSAGPFDPFYPLRVVVAGAALWTFRRAYTELRWTWSWTAAAAGILGFGLWLLLVPRPADPAAAAAGWPAALTALPPAAAVLWLVLRIAGAVVTVPLAEELAFRSYLTRRLMAADFAQVPAGAFSWTSFLVSSALFGAMHDAWVAGTAAGMLYALVWYRRGELVDAVIAHAVTNALLAVWVLATGAWWLWG
jgi:exosortase E/protease (VPEID-CTERM system)